MNKVCVASLATTNKHKPNFQEIIVVLVFRRSFANVGSQCAAKNAARVQDIGLSARYSLELERTLSSWKRGET